MKLYSMAINIICGLFSEANVTILNETYYNVFDDSISGNEAQWLLCDCVFNVSVWWSWNEVMIQRNTAIMAYYISQLIAA